MSYININIDTYSLGSMRKLIKQTNLFGRELKKDLDEKNNKILSNIGKFIVNDVTQRFDQPKSGISLNNIFSINSKFIKSLDGNTSPLIRSAPGEHPASDSGKLKEGTKFVLGRKNNNKVLVVYNKVPYAKYYDRDTPITVTFKPRRGKKGGEWSTTTSKTKASGDYARNAPFDYTFKPRPLLSPSVKFGIEALDKEINKSYRKIIQKTLNKTFKGSKK